MRNLRMSESEQGKSRVVRPCLKGINVLHLNKDTMIQIVQMWANVALLEQVNVYDLASKGTDVFEVSLDCGQTEPAE